MYRCDERMKPNADNPLTLDECAAIFKSLQDDFYEEYKMYDLSSLAIAMVFPMVSFLVFQIELSFSVCCCQHGPNLANDKHVKSLDLAAHLPQCCTISHIWGDESLDYIKPYHSSK